MTSKRVTKEELLALWRRSMDPEYTEALERELDGRGVDVIAAIAAVMERASDAAQRSMQAMYLKAHSTQTDDPSSGEQRAVGSISIFRRQLMGGTIFLAIGDVLVVRLRNTEGVWIDGVELELTSAAFIPSATEGPTTADVRAVRPGFQGNVPAGRLAAFVQRGRASVPLTQTDVALGTVEDTASVGGDVPDMFTADMVGRFFRFADGPNASMPAYRIVGFTPTDGSTVGNVITLDRNDWQEVVAPGTTGSVVEIADLGIDAEVIDLSAGRHGELDMLAGERGQGRAAGEDDETLRRRTGDLVDVVSPDAIVRTVSGILDPLGVGFEFIEIGMPSGRGFVWDLDAWDDPAAMRHGLFYYGSPPDRAWVVYGFVLVIDGSAFSGDETVINAIRNVVNKIKLGGMPWAIAFEPPL